MDGEFFTALKHRKMQEMEMKEVISDLVVYWCYVIIIFLISYGNRDPNAFHERAAIATQVMHGGLICGVGDEDAAGYAVNSMKKEHFPV